jgi:hypothetical protein
MEVQERIANVKDYNDDRALRWHDTTFTQLRDCIHVLCGGMPQPGQQSGALRFFASTLPILFGLDTDCVAAAKREN